MVSEACFTGKPVYVLHLPSKKSAMRLGDRLTKKQGKFALFHESLEAQNYTRKFTGKLGDGTGDSLDEATRVAKIICQKYKNL